MKKFSWFVSLLFVATLSFVSCEEPAEELAKVTFELFINDTDKQSVSFAVKPSSNEADYVALVCKSVGLSEYATDAELVAALGTEYNFADYLAKGEISRTINNLEVNTAYSLLVFAVDVTTNALLSDVARGNFRTDAVMSVDCTFNVETTITDNNASFIVQPSNRDIGWSFMLMEQMEYLEYTDSFGEHKLTASDLVKDDLSKKLDEYVANGGSLEEAVAEYVKVSNQKLKFENLSPKTEYVFLVGGVECVGADVYVISEVNVGRFTSGDVPMSTADFTMTATSVGAYGFVLNIESSNDDVYYFPTIDFPSTYDEAATIDKVNAIFEQQYQLLLTKYRDNPAMVTNELVLEESVYFSKGSKSFKVQNIPPQTEVMGAIFAMRPSTGMVAKAYTFEDLATTAAVSNINPSIKVVGVYSGDEENGAIFGDAAATVGRSIIVAESSNFDGASSVYAVLGERDRTDSMTNAFSDTNVLWYYDAWVDVNMNAPYSFHVANWDAKAYLFVYAKDVNGIEGGVGRTEYTPSAAEVGSISELQDYYNQANAGATAVPASLVIAE